MKLNFSYFFFGQTLYGTINNTVFEGLEHRDMEEIFKASNGFRFFSNSYPEFTDNVLYVWGSSISQDHHLLKREFSSLDSMFTYVNKLLTAIKELNDHDL